MAREKGWYRNLINRVTDWILSRAGKVVDDGVLGSSSTAIGAFLMRGLIVGDPTAASPLVWEDSPYNVSHAHIQEKFGGVEPLIVVAEGHDRDAMKDPQVLRTMEKFQRYLERDRDVGYSFSLTDILRTVNMVFHELEPKWGVIPNTVRDVGQTVLHLLLQLAADGDGEVRDARLHDGARDVLRPQPQGRQHRAHHRALQGVHRREPDGEGRRSSSPAASSACSRRPTRSWCGTTC